MAIEAVQIDFAARGVMETLRAFDRVEERIVRMERASGAASKTAARERVDTAKTEAEGRVRVRRQGLTQEEKAEREATRNVSRLQKEAEREATRGRQREAKDVERLEQWKLRVRRQSSEMAGRYAAKQAKEELRAYEQAARSADKLAAAEMRAQERAGAKFGRGATHALGSGVGAIGSVGSMALGAVGIGGGFLLADVARKQMSDQKQAALLVNAVTTGNAPPVGASVGNIIGAAGQASRELGMDRGQLIGAALEYSKKAAGGDFAGAMGNMAFFGKLSKVTGTDINELAGAAGTLQSQNKNLKAPEMQQLLLDTLAQAHAGNMSLADIAPQMGTLTAPATSFLGNQADVQRKLLGIGQIAAPQGSVQEAGTFVKDLVSEAAGHRKQLEKLGVHYNKDIKRGTLGALDSPEQLIESVIKGTGGDITKIEGIFGKRGTQAFRPLAKAFADAGGGAAGMEAVRGTMSEKTGATMTPAQLDAQNAVIDSTDAQKFQSALVSIEESLSTELSPALAKFAGLLKDHQGDIEGFIHGVSEAAAWFAKNPFAGVGAVLSLAIGKEVAAAGLKTVLEKALATQLGGNIAIAAATLSIGLAAIEILSETEKNRQKDIVARTNEDVNQAGRIFAGTRAGTLTPADIDKADKEAKALGQEVIDRKRRSQIAPDTPAEKAETKNVELAFEALTRAVKFATDNLNKVPTPAVPTAGTADNPARNGTMPSRADPRQP